MEKVMEGKDLDWTLSRPYRNFWIEGKPDLYQTARRHREMHPLKYRRWEAVGLHASSSLHNFGRRHTWPPLNIIGVDRIDLIAVFNITNIIIYLPLCFCYIVVIYKKLWCNKWGKKRIIYYIFYYIFQTPVWFFFMYYF